MHMHGILLDNEANHNTNNYNNSRDGGIGYGKGFYPKVKKVLKWPLLHLPYVPITASHVTVPLEIGK